MAAVASNEGFGSLRHLAVRFFGALSPAGPKDPDEQWARFSLLDGEQLLWHRMSGPDRRHAVGVARDAVELLGPGAPGRDVVAAALLHDVGKVESGLGTFARVGVTVAALVAGRQRLIDWSEGGRGGRGPAVRRRVGSYLTHDRIGADLLTQAGSAPLTVAWAAEHHLAPERWTVDPKVGAALKAADGD